MIFLLKLSFKLENYLLYLVLGLFGVLLIANVYFRYKVMRSYRKMVQAGVQAKAGELMNSKTLEEKIIPAHPQSEAIIREYVGALKNGFRLAIGLLALVLIFGYILMKFRNG